MNESMWKNENWWISPYNFNKEVRDNIEIPAKVEIHDATLRDGEQTPGVVFRKEDKIEIAKLLNDVGVERIEAGMPAVSKEDQQAIREISSLGLDSMIFSFARAIEGDIDMALDCGVDGVILEVPIGYPKLKYQFGWTWEDVLKKSEPIINYAKKKKLQVVYFPYDTTRAREQDLIPFLNAIKDNCPPDAIGIVDTMGCALPETVKYLVKKVKSIIDIPIEVHTHNDFGMAVATEMAGIAAGATCVHSCINGLGERTGNAPLEELIMGMQVLYGINNGYKLDKLPAVSEAVSKISGVNPALNKPVVGSRNYTRESGIGVDLVMKEPLAMFATNPAMFGRTGDVVLGKKSGKFSVKYMLEQIGVKDCREADEAEILKIVKSTGMDKRRLLTVEEFKSIVTGIIG